MGSESNKRIIKLPLESAATQITNTRYDLSPLIAYAKRHNKRLQDLTTEELAFLHYEENIEHLPLWEVHYIQGQQCRMIIRIDESNVLNAAIEHDDVANAPSFTVVESDGEWQLAVAHVPYCLIENWPDVEMCVKEVQTLWEDTGRWYLQNYVQLY